MSDVTVVDATSGPNSTYAVLAAARREGRGIELAGGPSPAFTRLHSARDEMTSRAFHRGSLILLQPMVASGARLAVGLGTASESANVNYHPMLPGEENVPHHHPVSADRIFVPPGGGTVADLLNDRLLESEPGQVIHPPAWIEHQARGYRREEIASVGGPGRAAKGLLREAGLLPQN